MRWRLRHRWKVIDRLAEKVHVGVFTCGVGLMSMTTLSDQQPNSGDMASKREKKSMLILDALILLL